MSTQSLGIHNIGAIICTVGGVRIQGTGDEGIAIEPATPEDIAHGISADGTHPYVEVTNDQRFVATFSVYQTSAAYARLAELRDEQNTAVKAASATAFDRRFYFRNPSTGDKVTSDRAVIVSRPGIMAKKANSLMEFKVLLPNPVIERGSLII